MDDAGVQFYTLNCRDFEKGADEDIVEDEMLLAMELEYLLREEGCIIIGARGRE